MQIAEAHKRLAEKFMFKNWWKDAFISDSLIQLVAHTYTEEEAEIVNALGFTGRSAKAVAKKVHRPVSEVGPLLKSMEDRIVIVGYDLKGIKLYSFLQMAPGVYEAQMVLSKGKEDEYYYREFARLFRELYDEVVPWLKPQIGNKDLRALRVIPVERAVDSTAGLGVLALPTDSFSETVDRNESFCIIDPCACRQEADMLGHGCGKPKDVCAVLGFLAEVAIQKGLARRISKEEFMETKMRGAEAGLVNVVDNVRDPLLACSCCGCCCGFLRLLGTYNIPTIVVKSHFEAVIDQNNCIGCSKCEKICPMKAITVDDKKAKIDYTRCIGCGVCVIQCKNNSIILKERHNYKQPDETKVEYALNRFFEVKGYNNPVLPRLSLGVGRLLHSVAPFHPSGPKYKFSK